MPMTAFDTALQRLRHAVEHAPETVLRCVVAVLRPDGDVATQTVARVDALCAALERDPVFHAALRTAMRDWMQRQRLVAALTTVGLLPRHGVLAEARRRFYDTFNPPPAQTGDLSDALRDAFDQAGDAAWLQAMDDATLWRWLDAVGAVPAAAGGELPQAWLRQSLDAMDKLSIWVAAEELEGELVRLEPRILERESPFSALQREVAAYVTHYRAALDDPAAKSDEEHDGAHLRVLLDQSMEAIAGYRRRSLKQGATITSSYLLERLEQTLHRIEVLLEIVERTPAREDKARQAGLGVFRDLAIGAMQRDSLRTLWRQTTGLLARKVSDNASEHGEHYISSDARGYLRMLRSCAGAGLIIPLMAIVKLRIAALGLPLLPETLLYCLDYGLGFILIHMLGFTVATKQPAMTAASLSNAIEREGRAGTNPQTVVELVSKVSRTQFIAIVGNVGGALLIAMLVSLLYRWQVGQPLVGYRQGQYLLASLHPFAGLALLHAAIAGVWLFVSGLIAGYFDNRYEVLQLGERFRQHPLWRRVLPQRWRDGIAAYLSEHYGALWGNFLFGFLLGMTGFVGVVLGLPIDIRHVAFSAANVGLIDGLTFLDLGVYLLFVLLVGAVNLSVSFGLAFMVALRARGLRLSNPRGIVRALGDKLRTAPWEFVLPPEAPRSERAP